MTRDSHFQLQQLAIASQQPSTYPPQSSQSLHDQVVPRKRNYQDEDTPLTQLNAYLEPGQASDQQSSGLPPSKKRSSAQPARTGQACDRCKVRNHDHPAH